MKVSKILAAVSFLILGSGQSFAATTQNLQGAAIEESQDYSITLACAANLVLGGDVLGTAIELTLDTGAHKRSPNAALSNAGVTISYDAQCDAKVTWDISPYLFETDTFATATSTITIDSQADGVTGHPIFSPNDYGVDEVVTVNVVASSGGNGTTPSGTYVATATFTLTAD